MTTIAANLKEIAADSRVSYEGVGSDVYPSVKLFTAHGAIYGTAGEDVSGQIRGIEWLREGCIPANRPDPPDDADWRIMELSTRGIAIYNTWMEREHILQPCLAIGSGRKVALYCMLHLKMTPAEAVAEACKVDSWSGPPIYVASIDRPEPRVWTPARRKARKR